MAKTAERKVEIAKRITGASARPTVSSAELLIFDVLTFTLTTGDDEWKPSRRRDDRGHPPRSRRSSPGVKTLAGRLERLVRRRSAGARAVLNSVFLHHCVEAGLDLAMVNPETTSRPTARSRAQERDLADDLVFNRRDDALELFINHFESKGPGGGGRRAADPTAGMEPEEALHFHILRRKKDGVEEWIDRGRSRRSARSPTLNEILLPAMKEVGDRFGGGELILPFVLQSRK